jgi:DNA polymerase-3 subunit epsilon
MQPLITFCIVAYFIWSFLKWIGVFKKTAYRSSPPTILNDKRALADKHVGAGQKKHKYRDYAGAIIEFNKAIEIMLNSSDGPWSYDYYFRGLSKYENRDYAGAIEDYTKAIEKVPTIALSWHYNSRGLAKNALKDYNGAIADYIIAIEVENTRSAREQKRIDEYSKNKNIAISYLNNGKQPKKDVSDECYILFFDTETTGLPKNFNAPATDLNNWPRMVQLAYTFQNIHGKVISKGNYIIKPDGYSIPSASSSIHGITTGRANREGNNLSDVLKKFNSLVIQSKYLVAHNINFDLKIIEAEFIRMKIPCSMQSTSKICTMESSTNYCAINGTYGYKWPTLSELYYKLFNSIFKEAHNAEIDVNATAKCFWGLKQKGIISLSPPPPPPIIETSLQKKSVSKVIAPEKTFDPECTHCNGFGKIYYCLNCLDDKHVYDDYEYGVVVCDTCYMLGEEQNITKLECYYCNKETHEN